MSQSRDPTVTCHLRFLGWDRPILESAAREILGDAGLGGGGPEGGGVADLSSHLIVLPGARAGRRLIEILVAHCESQGRALRPPRITTVGGLPEHLYAPVRPAPGSVVEGSAWRHAVGKLEPREWEALAPSAGAPGTPRGRAAGLDREATRASLAGTLREIHSKVGASGLDFGDVAERCRNGFLFSDEERWRVFAHAEREYRGILAAGGWADKEDARRRAIREDRVRCEGRLWMVALPDLSPIARAFLGALRSPHAVEILVGAPVELAGRFDPIGCLLPERWEEEPGGLPDSAIRVVTAPAEQGDAMIDHLRRTARGRSAEEITIGVPDRDVVPYVVERLSQEGIPSRYAEGRPVERTPLFGLLRVLTDFLEHGDAGSFSDLLRHTWIEGAIERDTHRRPPRERAIQSELDRYRTLHLPTRLGRFREALPSGGERVQDGPAPAVERARDLTLTLLKPLEGVHRLSEWPARLRTLLADAIGGEVEGELADVASKVGEALDGLESLAGLPGAAAALDEKVAAHAALERVLEELAGQFVPPEADEEAVELLGWLELALDDAPVLVITGANEPFLPESVTFDPFLPHALQESLGLLGNAGRWARDLLLVRTIVATRPDVLFVSGRQDSDGNPLQISRILLAEEPSVAAARIRAFLEGTSARAAPSLDEPGGTILALPPEGVISAPEPIDRLAVTAFRTLLTDPYRFALEKIRDLSDENDRARELDPLLFGSLAHRVLQRWAEGEGRDASDERTIRAELDEGLDAESASWFGPAPLPAARIQVEQLRRRLRAFARWQARWRGAGWRIRGIELPFAGEEAALVVDGAPMSIGGKVDRVDENETTHEWCILDYKTSEVAKSPEEAHRKGRAGEEKWIDLQLPLYRHLAHALRDREGRPLLPKSALESLRVGYLSLSRDPATLGEEWAAWTEAEWRGAIERAHEVVRFVRRNRFEYGEVARVEREDPLASVLGGGVLLLAEDEEGRADA